MRFALKKDRDQPEFPNIIHIERSGTDNHYQYFQNGKSKRRNEGNIYADEHLTSVMIRLNRNMRLFIEIVDDMNFLDQSRNCLPFIRKISMNIKFSLTPNPVGGIVKIENRSFIDIFDRGTGNLKLYILPGLGTFDGIIGYYNFKIKNTL